MPDNISKLYGALKNTYELGSEADFRKYLSDGNNREALRKELENEYDVGDSASFTKYLGFGGKPTQAPTVKPQAASKPAAPGRQAISPYLTGQQVSESTAAQNFEARMPEQFEATYNIGKGKKRKVNEDIHDVMKKEATPVVQQTVDRNGRVIREDTLTPYEPYEKKLDDMLDEQRRQPSMEQQLQQRYQEANKKLGQAAQAEQRETSQMYDDSPWLFVANAMGMSGSSAPGANMQMYNKKTNSRQIQEARAQMLADGLRLVQEVKQQSGEGDGIGTGLKQAVRNVAKSTLKKSTWDFGATDINTQTKLMEAIIRMDNGDELTDDERDLLNDWAISSAVSSNYGHQLSGWAKAGQVTGESLPFMLEMAMNPASGLGQAAQKGLVKYAVNKYGKKWVKDHAKGVLAGKIATRLVGDVLGGQAMAASTGLLRTVADAESRYLGKVQSDVDDEGNIIYGNRVDGDSPLTAFTKAWVANGIENSSEMWGEYLAPVTGYLSRMLGKAVIGKAGREAVKLTGRIGDVNLNKVQRFIYDVTNQRGVGAISQGLDKFLKKTQWHGVLGEYTEEELGNLANAMTVGDMTFDNAEDTGIFNLQQHIDTFNGVALMGGFMSALHTGGYAWDKYAGRMSKIDDRGNKLFADWEDIKTEINAVIDDNMALNSTITSFINNNNLSKDEKRVVLDYTAKVLEGKGAEMAEYQPRMQSSSIKEVSSPDGKKFVVTSTDAFGNPISQQEFNTQDEAQAYQGELKMQQQSRDMKDYLQMTGGLSYGESADLVNEFLGDEPTEQELADIQNPTTELGKQFQQFKTQRILDKARSSREAIAVYEEEKGWAPGTVRELAESDPMQMTEEELQMADDAREFLKTLAYPNTEVHTEISAQDGAETADGVVEMVASTEEPIDPLNNAGKELADQWVASQQAREQLFASNEDLAEEVTMMEQKGLSPQEILSSLDTFSPQDRQVLTDYYNTRAKFDAYMMQAENKINELATRNRQQRTFKGTINGQPDDANLIYITDGTNNYTLVSGNIQTDAQGRVVSSDSGMILAIDDNGDIVQLSDASTYSVQPSGISLDEYQQLETARLQEGVTQVTDPTGQMMQQQGSQTFPAGEQNIPNEGTSNSQEGNNTVGAEVAAEWLLDSGQNAINSTDYLLKALSGVFPKATQAIEAIRQKYAQQIANDPTLAEIKDFMNSPLRNQIVSEIKDAISQAYPNNAEVQDILDIIMQHPTGLPNRIGQEIQKKLDALNSQESSFQPPLTEAQADQLLAQMEAQAVEDPEISLTQEAWVQTFGLNNSMQTPIGNVKMGENQYQKLIDKKRTAEFGMVVQTLQDPDVVLVEPSQAKEGQETERPYSLVFVKTFIRNGEKIKFYASVTVQRDNMEVSVSSHFMNANRVKERLMTLERMYTKQALIPNSSEWHLAEQQNAVPDLLPTQENNASSGSKGTNNSDTNQVLNVKVDKNGVKLYEEGIAVDDAIADIVADGFDVNEIADASIAEAQQVIDKINAKDTKTRKDLMDRKKAQDAVDYYNNVKARWAEVNQPEAEATGTVTNSEENVNVQPEQPTITEKSVSSQQNLTVEEQKQQRIAEAKEKYGDLFDDDFTKANDVYELASMWVGRNLNLAWDDVNGKRGLQKELGWTRKIGGDTKYIETLLAKNGEGIGIDEFAHMVWESPENAIGEEKRWTTEEIKEALLDLLKSARSKSDVVDHALNTRIIAAEQALEAQQQMDEERPDQAEIEPLTDEKIRAMEANLPFAMSTDKGNIVELLDAIDELSQQKGMPEIQLVDTDFMSEEDWYDLTSRLNDDSFVSQEQIDETRSHVLADGLYIVEETGDITVYSDSQTAEELKQKVEYIRQNYGRSNKEETGGLEAQDLQRPETRVVAEAQGEDAENVYTGSVQRKGVDREDGSRGQGAQGAGLPDSRGRTGANGLQYSENQGRSETQNRGTEERAVISEGSIGESQSSAEGQGSPESVEDSYLQPRNAEEEQIIANVMSQLQQEIGDAAEDVNKANAEYQRARAKESDRATDIFANDETFAEPDAIFSQEEMGLDTSAEGVARRTREQREKVQEAQNKLNRLQSLEERNSRIRGALDNYRRQTSFEEEKPTDRWQYVFHYDKESGKAWITRDDWSRGVPIQDGRFRIEGKNLAELRGILENPQNNLGQILEQVEAQLHNAEVGEQMRRETNPIAAIEQAAQQFREEQAEKNYGADNKLVTTERYEELKKRMREKMRGQMNLGVDPEILAIGTEMAVYHIEAGARKFADYATRMINDLGDGIRNYLKAFYEGARRLPEMVELSKEMDSVADVDAFDVQNYDKQGNNTVNEHKQKDNEPENVVSLQQEPVELEGDSAEFVERQKKIDNLSKAINEALFNAVMKGDVKLKTMQSVKALASEYGLDDMSRTDLQELVEAEIVNVARDIAQAEAYNDEQKFEQIKRLYERQPTLSARDNDRINKQQYSTPAPMAYLMGQFLLKGKKVESGLEPSAGNGMLTINLPKEKMHVNDIDEMRLSNLQKQGFGEVTSQDGLRSFGEKQYDVVVTNPPFGNVTPKVYDGIYEISGLEHQMAINALESMKDDGRAAIIIGGNTEYNQNGSIKGKDRIFLNYLYAHYNVVDVINLNGHALYSKQGTGYPVRMILINGRKEFAPNSFAPTIQKARAERVDNYDELYKRVNDDILRNKEHNGDSSNGVYTAESGKNGGLSDNGNVSPSNETGVRNVRSGRGSGEHQLPTESVVSVQRGNASTETEGGRGNSKSETDGGLGTRTVLLHGRGDQSEQSGGSQVVSSRDGGREVADRGSYSQQLFGGSVDSGAGLPVKEQPQEKRTLGTEKVPYRQQSTNPFSLQSQMPAEQADVVKKALEDLGDVDQFLVDELGYSSKEELHQALAAEQIDSVAMAIHQMKKGDAFIIGDQTGIGKGRQGAALIRWAVKNGTPPVYFTAKPELFSSVYRDLKDIHSGNLRPFILASDKQKARIVEDKDGVQTVIFDLPTDKEQKRVLDYINKNGKLPPEYDFMITTYSQVGNGTMEYEEGKKKERKYPKGKSATKADYNGQSKRDAIENLAGNSIAIMDESHLAGGDSARGNYLQYVSAKAKGITYISATFAKRPDNMPIYSLRTAISKAGVKIGELIDAVKRGGATFQEIMSKALTEAGQMIRRERDMTGVNVDWKGIEDEEVVKKHFKQYDTVIGLFNDIINFQRTYVDPIVNGMNDAAAEEQGEVDHTPGTRDMGINNTPFASRTYNIVKQVLLSLKAEEGAKFAIECLKNGEKPVICLENTNEGAADKAVGSSGEDMTMPDLSVNLKEGLKGTLRITKKDANNNTSNELIPFDKLSPEGQQRYQEIMDAIDAASTGLSLSPIDVIKNEIRKAGYTVAELTGRQKEFIYNEDGTVKRVNRTDTDNKKNASDFNNGRIDAVIINKSAGTGIDLHAGIKFKNTDQRHMIVVQPQSDINDEVQMRGRTDRTGQKQHSKYTYIVSTIPSEQRLLMMLKAKLRSLDANTTSSQKSKFNEMKVQDIINKYGDDIVIQYLAENPDIAAKMFDPLKWGEGFEMLPPETLIANAQKKGEAGETAKSVLGKMALLKVAEQEKMLKEIGDMYQAEIDRLNEMGENDLEITEMPLKAKTLRQTVWEEGVEPGGKNPFADNSYVEEVEMDILKKPMKAEEVKKSQERLLGGKTWDEYKQDQLDKADNWAEEKKSDTRKAFTERAEKKASAEKEKYIKGAKKAQEKNGMTDEEIERNGQHQYDHFYKEEMDKLNAAIEGIDKQKQAFVDALETFTTDGVYALPTDIYDLSQLTFEPSFGKVIDIKISDNYSTNASTITFATLDGRRKITIPINGMVKQNNGEKRNIVPSIVQQTAQSRDGFFGSNISNMLKVLEQNLDNWDKLTSTATRKKGYIITGNLLKALTSLRSQGKGGKLISYTTDTGEIRQGILMSDNFDPKGLTSKNPISSAKEMLKRSGDKIESADGEVVVKVTNAWDWGAQAYNTLELIVPKSNKKGSKYFNDETLLSLVDGQFEGSTKMKAEFKRANLDAVLKRLDELGVTVKEDGITTADPMQAIRQAADSWRISAKESESSLSNKSEKVDSENNSVPLERRTLKSYTDKDGNYHKGIEEELRDIESAISGRGAGENQSGGSEVDDTTRGAGRNGVNELRREASKLRAEITRREQKKQEFRKKYNIDEKGNIALSDLRRMFHDLNSNKLFGKLFDKVADVVEKLGMKFRFTDNLEALTSGETFSFFNSTFFNWDAFLRDRTNQDKAKTILHELIHALSQQLLARYERPDLPKLNAAQKKLAKKILDIFEVVEKAGLVRKNGNKPRGTLDAHEMLSELGDAEFREMLDRIPYQKNLSALQAVKEWIKNVLRSFGINLKGNTALDSLERALDEVIDNYDNNGINEYRNIYAGVEKTLKEAGLKDEVINYVEAYELGNGSASKVEDKAHAAYERFKQSQLEADPMKAIKEAAGKWRMSRKEAAEDTEAIREYSAKEVYEQRVNTTDFVTSESYQDSMLGLKVIQNAIVHDGEIPDSQNAYMAENLVHGKSFNEQEQFNTALRAPLLEVVSRIIKKTGMNYDDVDRYCIAFRQKPEREPPRFSFFCVMETMLRPTK